MIIVCAGKGRRTSGHHPDVNRDVTLDVILNVTLDVILDLKER
jgi:hypothetical protein